MRSLLPFLVVAALPSLSAAQPPARDDLPPRALARLGDYRFYHGDKLGCYALNHDGRRVATGDRGVAAEHNKVIVWDGTTGEELRRWQIPGGGISCLDLSPDGKRVAVGCCNQRDKPNDVFLYDVDSGKLIHRLSAFKSGVNWLQFTLDGKRLHISEGDGRWSSEPLVTSWDAAKGECLKKWKSPQIPPVETDKDYTTWKVHDGRLSVDEKRVYWRMEVEVQTPKGSVDMAKRKTIFRAYDTGNGKQIYELQTPFWPITSSDGGRGLLLELDIVFRDMATGKLIRKADGISYWRTSLLPTGKQGLTLSGRREVKLFNVETLEAEPKTLQLMFAQPAFRSQIQYIDASADGKVCLASTDTTLGLVDVATGKTLDKAPGHRMPIEKLNFTPDGKTLFSRCVGQFACTWTVDDAKNLDRPWLPAISQNKEIEAGIKDSVESRFASLASGCWSLESNGSLSMNSKWLLLVGPNDKKLRFFDTRTHKPAATLESVEFNGQYCVFSSLNDKVILYSANPDNDSFECFDVLTGKRISQLNNVDNFGAAPVFCADGQRIAWITRDQRIGLADTAAGEVMRRLPQIDLRHDDATRKYVAVALSANGDTVVASSMDRDHFHDVQRELHPPPIRVFETASGRQIASFFVHPEDKGKSDEIRHLDLSPDGRLIVIREKEWRLYGSTTVRIIEVASGRTRVMFSGHRSFPDALAFSPDGKILASGGNDNVIYLWDMTGARTQASGKDMDEAACWDALADSDAVRAGEAMATFSRKPERAVAFLNAKLRPVAALEEKRLQHLLADLDADAFEKREAASKALSDLGELAEPALRRVLKDHSLAEAKRRIGELLEKLDGHALSPEALRGLRANEILEHIGTPAARRLLETIAAGAEGARVTQDAKASLKRLTPPARP